MSLRRSSAAAAALAAAACMASVAARADAIADFYHGKTITLAISSSPGGGYDTLSRAIGRYLGRHLPGNPSVNIRNMPGAGGIVATSWLAKVAPRDGLTIGGVQNNTPFEPLFGTKEADYDATKLTWLGTPSIETGTIFVWQNSPFRSIFDARTREMTAGASGANSTPAFYARLLDDLFGLKIKVIPGFPGQNEAYLAIERGELDTYGTTFWSSLTSTKSDWIRDKKIRVLIQFGPEKEPALKDVPYGPDLVNNEDDRLLFEAADAPLAAGRPFVAPPDLPPDRAKALRAAMFDTFNDPDFRAEARQQQLEINKPTSGEALQAFVQRVYGTPQRVIDRLRRISQDY